MRYYADLHIHSKYARACSPQLDVEHIDLWCRIKGLGLVATADFTHPKWFEELTAKLEPKGNGLYRLKPELRLQHPQFTPVSQVEVSFMCATEVACIYKHAGAVRRVHHCIFAPSLEVVSKINAKLTALGCNLRADGRPILGLSSKRLLEILLEIDGRNVLIPAHAWTPWFAIFGSKSGYDSIQECFEDLTPHIFAIETGLSSDPPMNWRISALDNVALVSHSDAHSLPNLGREANVLEGSELSYAAVMQAVRGASSKRPAQTQASDLPLELVGTVEFFPDEGRYHYDGHRACNMRLSPEETAKHKGVCPVCGRELTIGVLNRVNKLADRAAGFKPRGALPFWSLLELDKLIAEAQGIKSRQSKLVEAQFWQLVSHGRGELPLLLDTPLEIIESFASPRLVEAIQRLRGGKVALLEPGFDGEYGTVHLFGADERSAGAQASLF